VKNEQKERERRIFNGDLCVLRITKSVKKIISLLTLLVILTLPACDTSENNIPPTETPPQATTATTELTVWGMMCASCANSVTRAVSAIDGVTSVSVNVAADRVTIQHAPDLDTSIVERAIMDEGFDMP